MAVKGKKKKQAGKIRVASSKCVGCSYCKLNCPVDAMAVEEAVAHTTRDCIRCGTCVWVCPVGAIYQS